METKAPNGGTVGAAGFLNCTKSRLMTSTPTQRLALQYHSPAVQPERPSIGSQPNRVHVVVYRLNMHFCIHIRKDHIYTYMYKHIYIHM